jgi:hypothetical protein
MGQFQQNSTDVPQLIGAFAVSAKEDDFGIKLLDLLDFVDEFALGYFGFLGIVIFEGDFL